MKQRITVEQLKELTPEQQDKLREFWQPRSLDVFASKCTDGTYQPYAISHWQLNDSLENKELRLPLFSIGQMIELLHSKYCDIQFETAGKSWFMQITGIVEAQETELADALWFAVKAVL